MNCFFFNKTNNPYIYKSFQLDQNGNKTHDIMRDYRLFDDELFIRTSKGMIPTPVANQIIKDVRSALSLIQNTISESEKFDPYTAEVTFKVSIGDTS